MFNRVTSFVQLHAIEMEERAAADLGIEFGADSDRDGGLVADVADHQAAHHGDAERNQELFDDLLQVEGVAVIGNLGELAQRLPVPGDQRDDPAADRRGTCRGHR